MVMKPEPVFEAVESVLGLSTRQTPPEPASPTKEVSKTPIILLTPQGRVFNQRIAEELSGHERIGLICGRYEGVDERVREHLVTDEISIGDYVLTGGELPALMLVDTVSRLIPGVLGDPIALKAARGDVIAYARAHLPSRDPMRGPAAMMWAVER